MKRGKRSAEDRARSRLLDYWQRKPEYGEPIGCVATSFSFDAAFFEEQCLARFVGMETDPAEDERGYRVEREEKLAPSFSAVIVDQRHVPALRSLRWHAFGARVPREGVFHPKLALLVWHQRVRLVIGSANLTETGYRKNLENVGSLDFTPEGDLPRTLLEDVLGFLDDVRTLAPGASVAGTPDTEVGPQARLRRFFAMVRAHVARWPEGGWARGEPRVSLAFVGPGRPSLFEQLRARWPFAPATDAWVMSPFFDAGGRARTTAEALESLLIQRGDRRVGFIVSGRRQPDGTVELDMPAALAASANARVAYTHELVIPAEGEEPRQLHAKTLWLERDGQALYCVGSSNFTQAGTGVAPGAGAVNVEANLVYELPSLDSDFARVCQRAYPATEALAPGLAGATFLDLEDHTPEPTTYEALPACFGAATLRITGDERWLELEVLAEPPPDFAVVLGTGEIVIAAAAWSAEGRPRMSVRRLEQPQPPSYVSVMWGAGLDQLRAIWPVNAQDPSLLPHPAELRDLTLEELLEVLTSARPAHEAIGRIHARRERAARGSQDGRETDPLKRVDTRNHLLKRLGRAAAAMEELRARLERPSFSDEALRARIHGPLGPLALAQRLVIEEPAGAAFLIAELAATVASARLDPRGELTPDDAHAQIREVVRELAGLAARHPAPANLRAYVDQTFAEVAR